MKDITIVVPTCYRQAYPSTRVMDATIESLHRELPDTPIIITCDGVRESDKLTVTQYENYRKFRAAIVDRYKDAQVVTFDKHSHQTGNLGGILHLIQTPTLFYVEDDWDIRPHVPWEDFVRLIVTGEFNYIKLHAAARIHPLHEHMMRGRIHFSEKLYFVRTVQFSANPHLASTEWYRKIYESLLRDRDEFIEGVMHGPVGSAPWDEFKLAIYDPVDYDMYRCLHLDGKGATD